jgi:polyisoprenoid-binding protein YceI
MRTVFGVLGLAALLAAFGCTGSPTGSTVKNPPPPVAVGAGGEVKPMATGGAAPAPGGTAAGGAGAITPEGSKIEFVGSAPDHKHDGGFKKFSGSVKPAGDDVTKSTINVEIDIDSIWTDDDDKLKKLTPHLKSPDFFDAKKYPTATFVSKEIKAEKKGDDTHLITGDLTLHGTTKSVSIPAKVTTTDDAVTIDGKFTIDRMDFGIGKTFDTSKLLMDVPIKVQLKVARK